MDLKWRAIYEIEGILKSSCPMVLKISAIRFLEALEYEVEENEIIGTQTSGVDATLIINNQRQYEEFRILLGKSCDFMYKFWQELLEKKPSGNRLQELGFDIARVGETITTRFQQMTFGENNRGLRLLEIYGEYLRYVVNEPEDAKRILDKVESIKSSLLASSTYGDEKRLRNYENASPSIIVVSGDEKTMGEVISVNIEALNCLEMVRTEILGSNINIIMPKIYAIYHNKWMTRYFDENRDVVMGHARKVYTQNRRGFVFPIDLFIKVIPDLSDGIQIVGIFTKMQIVKPQTLLINTNTGEITGLTQGCYEAFGIHPALCYGNSQSSTVANILQLFPEINSLENLRAHFVSGHEYTLDTRPLASMTLTSRTEMGDFGVAPPKSSFFKTYLVRTTPGIPQSHGVKGLSVFELSLQETAIRNQNITRLGAMIGDGVEFIEMHKGVILKPIKDETWNKSEKMENIESSEDSDASPTAKLRDGKVLKDEEIEMLNYKAERERKLKEHRQMLKKKATPTQVIFLYVVVTVCVLLISLGHTVSLAIKLEVLAFVRAEMETLYFLSNRAVLVPDLVFHVTKFKNIQL